MSADPIVEEVRRIRAACAARFDFDLHAICRDLRAKEKNSGRRYVVLRADREQTEPAFPKADSREDATPPRPSN